MQGTIFSGDKAATKIMEDYLDKFKDLFGKDFSPGTLNLELEKKIDWSKWEFLKGFTKEGRNRGGVYYKEGRLETEEVIFLRPEMSKYTNNVIEAISEKNLRKALKLRDRDQVEVVI